MIGRIVAPKDVHALIQEICGYATLHGKRDSADMIKVVALETGRLSWIIQVDPI